MKRYTRFLLLAIFIGAVLLIVVLQFNSVRSISNLISSNQRILRDFDVKADLNELKGNIVVLESKVRGLVISGHLEDTEYLRRELDAVGKTLYQLDKSRFDSNIHPFVDNLEHLVDDKTGFNQQVLDTFRFRGKLAAEQMINSLKGRLISDSIVNVIDTIDHLHSRQLAGLIDKADVNGQRAKDLGTLMALIAVLASIFTFSYALLKVNQQQQLISLLNISEQKALKAGEAKENFLSNMSHEIRTPLNAILGFANLLAQKKLDSEAQTYITTIRNAGENLLTIINDVLDSSKIEAGMMHIEEVPFSLSELVRSVETMFRQRTSDMLAFNVRLNKQIPDVLSGDPVRLTQILVNILNNAFKFTTTGEITMEVNGQKKEEKVLIRFSVSDTGVGIEEEKLEKIFERFQQAEDSVTRKYGGTGLGLSIVKELVVLQNGTIEVESTPGIGTKFIVSIPYKAGVAFSPSVVEGFLSEDFHSLEKEKVLVVEDNEVNQLLIRHIFNRWGLDFTVVDNGKKAIAELSGNNYACVLMDIQMPELDGYSATLEIRNRLGLQIPIIAMTAHVMAGEKEKCLSYGMSDYISKPLQELELFSLLKKYLLANSYGNGSILPDVAAEYQYINLTYMEEVAQGDLEYKRLVTRLFIESVPEELRQMEEAFQTGDFLKLHAIVHNFKTTVSVMGLGVVLQHVLVKLEADADEGRGENLSYIIRYCIAAVEEAKHLLTVLMRPKDSC